VLDAALPLQVVTLSQGLLQPPHETGELSRGRHGFGALS
jgi:hypothetical protein